MARFDAGDPAQGQFTSYRVAGFPDARDTGLDEYAWVLRQDGPTAVRTALETVSEKGRQVLRAYAERAVARAVRDKDRDLLVLGSIALVVGGLDQNALEALTRIPLIEDASKRLGIELADVFEEVAGIVGHPGSVSLVLWLSRAPENRTLECMGFSAAEDGSGFRYRQIA